MDWVIQSLFDMIWRIFMQQSLLIINDRSIPLIKLHVTAGKRPIYDLFVLDRELLIDPSPTGWILYTIFFSKNTLYKTRNGTWRPSGSGDVTV